MLCSIDRAPHKPAFDYPGGGGGGAQSERIRQYRIKTKGLFLLFPTLGGSSTKWESNLLSSKAIRCNNQQGLVFYEQGVSHYNENLK